MTEDTERREGGAWIGQHPNENTDRVREQLDEGAERVAVTNNESGGSPDDESWPQGHREGGQAGDDDVVVPARTVEPMEQERDATSVNEPSGRPPDEGLAYDPSMTDEDEANIPPESDADPESEADRDEA